MLKMSNVKILHLSFTLITPLLVLVCTQILCTHTTVGLMFASYKTENTPASSSGHHSTKLSEVSETSKGRATTSFSMILTSL